MMRLLILVLLLMLTPQLFSQCENFQFAELGYEPAYCRTSSVQSGHAVVYAAATGGNGSYTYEWKNMQTGQTVANTTWGGLNTGNYKITVTDSLGCVLTEQVKVDSVSPQADFEVFQVVIDSSVVGYPTAEVILVNKSKHCGDFILIEWEEQNYYWNLNGNETWEAHYIHEDYTAEVAGTGFYSVCLAVENTNECVDTVCKSVSITSALFETEWAQLFYSSLTGEVSIELLIAEQAYLILTSLTGSETQELILVPGTNTFFVEPGIYVYQLIHSVSGDVLLDGTLVISE